MLKNKILAIFQRKAEPVKKVTERPWKPYGFIHTCGGWNLHAFCNHSNYERFKCLYYTAEERYNAFVKASQNLTKNEIERIAVLISADYITHNDKVWDSYAPEDKPQAISA